MPSGGARVRSGPPPQRGAVRRGRSSDDWVHLPAAGRPGDSPAFPLPRPSKFELAAWEREWRRPQAIAWEALGWEIQVALYVRTLRAAAGPKATSGNTTNLLRQMASLGLTADGLARNHWVIDGGPTAIEPKRPATSNARDRIRSLQGGLSEAAS